MTLMSAKGIQLPDKKHLPITAALFTDHKLISLGLPALSGSAMVLLTDVYYGRDGIVQLLASNNEWDILFLSIGYQKMSDMRMVTKVISQKTTTSVVIVAPFYNQDEERIYKNDGAKAYIMECNGVNNNCESISTVIDEINQRRIKNHKKAITLCESISDDINTELFDEISPCERINTELFDELSPRERDVINCFVEGMSVTQIANVNKKSIKTISSQKRSAMRKLGLDNSMAIFRLFRKGISK